MDRFIREGANQNVDPEYVKSVSGISEELLGKKQRSLKMEWIECSDRLPDHLQSVKFKVNLPFECEGFFEKNEEGGYQFFHKSIVSEKKIYSIYGVTHWMPLSEPPNEP